MKAPAGVVKRSGAQIPRWRVDSRAVRRLYWWSFLLRVLAGLFAYVLSEYADIPLMGDARYYEEIGYAVANEWLDNRPSDWLDAHMYGGREPWLMIVMVAVLYYLMQGIRVAPIVIVFYGAVTAWVPVYTYWLANQLGVPEAAARRAGWLVALSPAFVFWSGSLFKEGLVLLILNLVAYHTLRLQSRWQWRSLAIVALCVFALLGLRFYLATILSIVVTFGLLLGRRSQVPARLTVPVLFRQALIALMFVGLMFTLGFRERAERPLLEDQQGILVQLDVSRRDLATSAYSGYVPAADVSTLGGALWFFPIGLAYFLLVPLPWQIAGIRETLAMLETLFWVMLYPLIVMGMMRGLRVNWSGTLFLVALTGAMCVAYALLAGNVGVAYRMRTQIWLLWAPFVAWGWEAWQERRRAARAAMVLAA